MATYHTPGVYIEENLAPLAPSSGGPGTAIAAFIGSTPSGAIGPVPLTSWAQFVQRYGGFGDTTHKLPYAVYEYFTNGGSACYISRAITTNAVVSTGQLMDIQSAAAPGLQVDAISPGEWGTDVSIGVKTLSDPTRFDLLVRLDGDADSFTVERWPDCSVNPADPRYVVNIVNSRLSGSNYIRLTNLKQSNASWSYDSTRDALAAVTALDLSGGSDGTGNPDKASALRRLDQVFDALVVNLPGETTASVLNDAISWAETRGTAFVVVDGPQAAANSSSAQITQTYVNMLTGSGSLTPSSYAAIYAPWLQIADPSSSVPGAMRTVPPGGAVLGRIARNDVTRGVGKAPAGLETSLSGVLDLETRFTGADTDALNDGRINAIRLMPGAGFVIMGARTLKDGYPDRYINVRRTLITLRKDLTDLTRFAIFENNDEALWGQISAVVTQYLTTLMQVGILRGNTPDQAFFVQCNADNNPPSTADIGRVNVTVGVALSGPAEFVVISIGQYDGGTSVVDNTNAATS